MRTLVFDLEKRKKLCIVYNGHQIILAAENPGISNTPAKILTHKKYLKNLEVKFP